MELTGRQIRISVRNLVEFVLRSGDIDNRRTAGAQREAMLAGGTDAPEDTAADGIRVSGGGVAAPFGGGGRIPNRGRGACGWNHPGWKRCHDR